MWPSSIPEAKLVSVSILWCEVKGWVLRARGSWMVPVGILVFPPDARRWDWPGVVWKPRNVSGSWYDCAIWGCSQASEYFKTDSYWSFVLAGGQSICSESTAHLEAVDQMSVQLIKPLPCCSGWSHLYYSRVSSGWEGELPSPGGKRGGRGHCARRLWERGPPPPLCRSGRKVLRELCRSPDH